MTDTWMQEHYPERWALRSTPHAFEPMAFDAQVDGPDHVCGSGCVCNACWERMGDVRRLANPHRARVS